MEYDRRTDVAQTLQRCDGLWCTEHIGCAAGKAGSADDEQLRDGGPEGGSHGTSRSAVTLSRTGRTRLRVRSRVCPPQQCCESRAAVSAGSEHTSPITGPQQAPNRGAETSRYVTCRPGACGQFRPCAHSRRVKSKAPHAAGASRCMVCISRRTVWLWEVPVPTCRATYYSRRSNAQKAEVEPRRPAGGIV